MLKRTFTGLAAVAILAVPLMSAARAEAVGEETRAHPEMAHAIHVLEDSIAHMQAAPHDFGGHRARTISASRKAIRELREALFYRQQGERWHAEHRGHQHGRR